MRTPRTTRSCTSATNLYPLTKSVLETSLWIKSRQNVQFVNIGRSKYAIIPKAPNGVYFYWALTVQNPVFPDDVCNSMHTKWALDESNFKLEHKMYSDVLGAYEKKINAQEFHCLKHIKVSINSLLQHPQKTENSTLLFFKFAGLFHPHNTEPSVEPGSQNQKHPSHRRTASDSGSETDSVVWCSSVVTGKNPHLLYTL
jgi:hypothetical protein